MIKNLSTLALFATLGACTGSGLGSVAEYDDLNDGGARIVEGSPTAVGILAFLNDAGTTYELLDHEVGLDRRAAESIIAHRNGPDGTLGWLHDDLFDTIAEVDGCYYVGRTAIEALEEWAVDHGWVPLDDDDVLGTWDGVTFTVGEARATVELANTAGPNYLDHDLALDGRAVDSIVAARPIQSVEHLAGLYYVGGSALDILKETAAGVPGCDKPGWDIEYVYASDEGWQTRLPAELLDVIDTVVANDTWCESTPHGEPWFVMATVDRFECEPKGYVIELGQAMYEYPSSTWYIEFEVTEDFEWFHSTCEV